MSIDVTTFRKIVFTAGIVTTAAVFAGCAFNSLNAGVGVAAPAAAAKEYVVQDETTLAAKEETSEPAQTSEDKASEANEAGETTAEETTSEATAENTEKDPLSVKVTFAGDCTLCSLMQS